MEKVTINTLRDKKAKGERVVCLTAYDHPFATIADKVGIDVLLVGDSLAMTTLGYKNTILVTMDEMISHARAVTAAASRAFVVGDMPFMSYQPSGRNAVLNASRFVQIGCDAVKLEGGVRMASRIRAIVDAGIVVQGHIGLTPQSMGQQGGYRVQGRTDDEFSLLIEDALAVEKAGASLLLLEAMPPSRAAKLRSYLKIPVYGIGAGPELDGQLLIVHDILGLCGDFKPKFAKRYADVAKVIEEAMISYATEVRNGSFPSTEFCYSEQVKAPTKDPLERAAKQFLAEHPGC